jgi:hypothetical protein
MEGKKFSTPLADFYIKNGIVYGTFFGISPTLEQAQEHVRIVKEALKDGAPFLSITDISAAKSSSKEVRECLSSQDMVSLMKANALIAGSVIGRMMGNLFVRFSKMDKPISFFSNEAAALKWLEQYK